MDQPEHQEVRLSTAPAWRAALARDEAAKMRAAAARTDPGANIRMTRDQFLRLADMLEQLAQGPQGCGDPDCFNALQQGVRTWVPADHVEREFAELARLRQTDRCRADQILPRRLAS
jgi:hypothetical protein